MACVVGGAVLLLAGAIAASLGIGSRAVPWSDVWAALFAEQPTSTQSLIRSIRLPRTMAGVVVGLALGAAGVVSQTVLRNPLADPGLLGVSAGAALGAVLGIVVFGITSISGFVWCAFVGAGLVTLGVVALGVRTPARTLLAGLALSTALDAITAFLLLVDRTTLERFRSWGVGSLSGRDLETVMQVVPIIGVGLVTVALSVRTLDGLALPDDSAMALGIRLAPARTVLLLSMALLCAAATALVGPLAFVGLAVPHIARSIVGPRHDRLLPAAMVLGVVLLLGADVIGRVLVRPAELEVGVMVAIVGAPTLIVLALRGRPGR